LQLDAKNSDLIVLNNIRRTLEQMSQNEAFMAAIQEDVLASEAQAEEEAAMTRIENGEDPDEDDEQYQSDNLPTVQEGNETNQLTTTEKGALITSQPSTNQRHSTDAAKNNNKN